MKLKWLSYQITRAELIIDSEAILIQLKLLYVWVFQTVQHVMFTISPNSVDICMDAIIFTRYISSPSYWISEGQLHTNLHGFRD